MANITRRSFLFRVGGVAAAVGPVFPDKLLSQAKQGGTDAIEISPTEDLMREHGLLQRLLLIYQEWIERLGDNKSEQIDSLAESSKIVRLFVEDYHEKLEEEHLFPRLKKAGKLVDLVDVLRVQHKAGRKLTDETLKLCNPDSLKMTGNQKKLSGLLKDFVRMYRPHAAREDTVLFPVFNEIVPISEYDQMGDIFEAKENKMFGEHGFEKMVDRVSLIERALGIYDLSRFTPTP